MHARIVLVALALAAGVAQAQLKPPSNAGAPTTPSKPAAPPQSVAPAAPEAPATDPATMAKEAAAARVATEWLELIDAGDYGKAWDECSPLFKQKVSRQQWVDGLPKNRAEYGGFKSRKLDAGGYRRTALPGAPEGEYVTLRFISEFEKNANAEEVVTLAFQDGAWRPIGYLLR